ncbi:MAG: acetoin utilization protein AcuC [Pseudomonadota bacterium]|nr:acetoin utilization protein AcuC [Desulfobacterales bacterium]MBU0698187.1 acetoin utilization protein AcuC [Pseudomonadota bacterium]
MNESVKEVLVFSKKFGHHSYGPRHPLKVERLQLTMDLIGAYGLFNPCEDPWVEAREADEQDLLRVHKPEYLEILKQANTGQVPSEAWQYGLGSGDNPVFAGLYDWSILVAGATMECIRQVRDANRRIAFNIAGGLHHALPGRASGFCYINDPAVGIAKMVLDGLRVVYLDIDVHHGDGVEAVFYNTDQVLTISLHQHGHTLFPGTGFPDEMGQGAGRGYAVNVPLAPGTDDDLYLWAFMEVVPPLVHAYKPDVLVTQLGVDTMTTDPLASLNLTTDGFCKVLEEIKSWNLRWVALGGGGYNVMNVARAWTRAWAVMRGAKVPDDLPEEFVSKHRHLLGGNLKLSESTPMILPCGRATTEQARQLAEAVVAGIKENIFPIVGA